MRIVVGGDKDDGWGECLEYDAQSISPLIASYCYYYCYYCVCYYFCYFCCFNIIFLILIFSIC